MIIAAEKLRLSGIYINLGTLENHCFARMGSILNGWWEGSYTSKRGRVLLHIFFWISYLTFLASMSFQHLHVRYDLPLIDSLLLCLFPVSLTGVFYFFIHTSYNSFQKKQLKKAGIGALITFFIYSQTDTVSYYFLIRQLNAAGIPSKYGEAGDFLSFYSKNALSGVLIVHGVFWFMLYMFTPVGCKIFRDMQRSKMKLQALKERNVQLELNLIKSQVNPHFLLNTLNNIYGVTMNGTRQQIGDMILNLSDFLKYSLYECSQEFVPLSKEIKLIENFVELESVRSDFIKTDFKMDIDERSYNIPPFILFPLIENAFKHGTQQAIRATLIKVELSVLDNSLKFRVENDIQTSKANKGGIGLTALKKKLEYYYPETSFFSSSTVANRYIAELQIDRL